MNLHEEEEHRDFRYNERLPLSIGRFTLSRGDGKFESHDDVSTLQHVFPFILKYRVNRSGRAIANILFL